MREPLSVTMPGFPPSASFRSSSTDAVVMLCAISELCSVRFAGWKSKIAMPGILEAVLKRMDEFKIATEPLTDSPPAPCAELPEMVVFAIVAGPKGMPIPPA